LCQSSFKSIQSLIDLQHEGDYQDFAEITKEEELGYVEGAKMVIGLLKDVLTILLSNK
jgi:hypothetical protein